MDTKKCPCGEQMIHSTNQGGVREGRVKVWYEYAVQRCLACGHVDPDNDAQDAALEWAQLELTQKLAEVKRKKDIRDARWNWPADYYLAIRHRLNLTQLQMGCVIGGGQSQIVRYESGATTPALATTKLYYLLDKNPHLLGSVQDPE